MITGNRFHYCRDNSLHMHRCMLGLREELNFLSHSFSHSSHSFSPPSGTSGPELKQWLKTGRRRGSEIRLAFGMVSCIHARVRSRERAQAFWWLSRNVQCNKPAGCDLADATVVERKALLSSPPVAARICCLSMSLLVDCGPAAFLPPAL